MNLKQRHGFRITVERLPLGDDTPENRTDFDVGSHDDLLDIMRRVRSIDSFQTDEAYALAVGIKLFSGVMLTHPQRSPVRRNPAGDPRLYRKAEGNGRGCATRSKHRRVTMHISPFV